MNHSIVASSLIIGSIITISNASYVLMPYNCIKSLPGEMPLTKDAIYTEFTIYLVLASIGVVLGLYALMYPDHFKNLKYLLPTLTYVWLIVTFVCTSRLFVAFNSTTLSILSGQLSGSMLGILIGRNDGSFGNGGNTPPSIDISKQFTEKLKTNHTGPNPSFNQTGLIVQYVITSLLVVLTTLFTFVF